MNDTLNHMTVSSTIPPFGAAGMTSGVSQPSDAGRDLVVTLRPTTRCVAPVVALRLLLKTALRVHGLRCVGIRSPDSFWRDSEKT